MDTTKLILAETFCTSHKIEFTYIYNLQDYGFIELVEDRETVYIKPDELPKLEQIVRFNRDLEINLEGIEVILNLLERIENLQEETRQLNNKVNPLPASPRGRGL